MEFIIDNPGLFIKMKRKELNLTLSNVANSIDLTSGYLSRIENGSSTPSLETLHRLSTLLDFKLEEICSFTKVNISEGNSIELDDLLRGTSVTIGGQQINEYDKIHLSKIMKKIYELNWSDDLNKMNYISDILISIDEYKKGK